MPTLTLSDDTTYEMSDHLFSFCTRLREAQEETGSDTLFVAAIVGEAGEDEEEEPVAQASITEHMPLLEQLAADQLDLTTMQPLALYPLLTLASYLEATELVDKMAQHIANELEKNIGNIDAQEAYLTGKPIDVTSVAKKQKV